MDDRIEQLSDDLDTETRLTMVITEDDWAAVCNPDASTSDEHACTDRHAAPFNFRTIGDAPSDEVVGGRFDKLFQQQVTDVKEMLDEEGNPLQAILDMEPPDLVTEDDGL